MSRTLPFCLKISIDPITRPQGRTLDKETCVEVQTRWNHAIDEYISHGTDKRQKIEIERAAKIGRSLGALYKKCEGVNCERQEGKDIDKLVCCSKCKIVSALHKKSCSAY